MRVQDDLNSLSAAIHHGQGKSTVSINRFQSFAQLISGYNRTLIVRMVSTAQTGYFYTTQRLRIGPTLSAVKYDPKGEFLAYFSVSSVFYGMHSQAACAVRREQENGQEISACLPRLTL